jgi:hypothetical protein
MESVRHPPQMTPYPSPDLFVEGSNFDGGVRHEAAAPALFRHQVLDDVGEVLAKGGQAFLGRMEFRPIPMARNHNHFPDHLKCSGHEELRLICMEELILHMPRDYRKHCRLIQPLGGR